MDASRLVRVEEIFIKIYILQLGKNTNLVGLSRFGVLIYELSRIGALKARPLFLSL